MNVLTVNVGSSTLKLSFFGGGDDLVARYELPAPRGKVSDEAIEHALKGHGPVDAVGHRIVHGGNDFSGPIVVDRQVRERLDALVDLAPLHLPKSLAGLDALSRLLPEVAQVACFDTAFHSRMPAAASTYALPFEWRQRWALRRYGFHGLSHSYLWARSAELCGSDPESLRIVSCHLGSGASLAAVLGGRSVDTTMGFTPLEGLVMGTRSGSVDPGLVLWLEEHVGLPPGEVASNLEHRSGLMGLAGSGDFQTVLEAEHNGEHRARLAIEVYLHRLRAEIAAMTAAMGGLDALVFAGGVGEHAASIRSRAAQGLDFLGIRIDEQVNGSARPDVEITAAGGDVRIFIIETREDLQILREVRRVLAGEVPVPP
jgi:acetate kinase